MQELEATFGVPVVAIADLDDVLAFVGARPELAAHAARIEAYRAQYGAQ